MVIEMQDSGVCLSTEPNSPTAATRIRETPPTADIISPECDLSSTATAVDDKNRSTAAVDSDVFVFDAQPPPADNETTTKRESFSSDSLTPTSEPPSEATWPPPPNTDHSGEADSSSVVDSGWESRGSPVSFDNQRFQTPSPQSSISSLSPATTSSTAARNADQGSIVQRRSFTQRLKGVFNLNTTKKSPSNGRDSVTEAAYCGSASTGLPMSAKDQKIISLMMRRQEEERLREERRNSLYLSSQKSKKTSEIVRTPSRPTSTVGEPRSRSSTMETGGLSRNNSLRTSRRRQQLTSSAGNNESTDSLSKLQLAPPCDSRRTSIISTSAASKTSEARSQSSDASRMKFAQKSDKRRQSVEQRLEQQRREMEEHQKQLILKQEQELQRANSVRLSREQQQAMRARLANEKVQQKHEMISRQRQKSVNDLSTRREEIDARLAAAEVKAQKIKTEELQKTKSELQKRLELSRQRQRQMESELENWQQELIRFNQWQGDVAEKAVRQSATQRSAAACRTRLEKEKKQQENMKRLMTNDEKRMAEMEATIETKDARTKLMQKEKEDQILRSRHRAMAMKQVRDELRSHYSMNDLDQLSRQAALENRLLMKTPESSTNTSLMTSMMSLAL